MTNIPLISDGEPVTYQFLNTLVGAVNKLAKPDTDGEIQDITITGQRYSLTKSQPAAILIGTFSLNFGSIKNAKQSTAQAQVEFDKAKFKSAPLVFVSAVDPSSDDNSDISYISLTVTSISATQFKCKARRMIAGKDATNKDKIDVNFIAIGQAP